MSSSGTYQFRNSQVEVFVRESFERCGLISDELEGLKIDSALASMNFMFAEWMNRGLNLWAIYKGMLPVIPGQQNYTLPYNLIDITELVIAQTTRVISTNGIAYSSAGGVANNAFDGNPTTSCIQNAPNGYISYDFGAGVLQPIFYVGIQSNINTTYQLVVEYSYDAVLWKTAYVALSQEFIKGMPNWYALPSYPGARYWRIRETGGATLNVQEIYFNIPSLNGSRLMARISRSEYAAISNKLQTSSGASYYIDRTQNPVLNLWPTPDGSYPFLIFNYTSYVQDIDALKNTFAIPQRFFEAIASELAARLSVKFKPERYDLLSNLAKNSFDLAAREDTERVNLRIEPDYLTYN